VCKARLFEGVTIRTESYLGYLSAMILFGPLRVLQNGYIWQDKAELVLLMGRDAFFLPDVSPSEFGHGELKGLKRRDCRPHRYHHGQGGQV